MTANRNPHAGESDPHEGQPVATAGEELSTADAAVVFVHGRGATAEGMLEMASEFDAEGVAYLAPQARGRTWYPHSFLEDIERNEPSLSSALDFLGDVRQRVLDAGIPADRTCFVGFSQGACLSSEFVARNPTCYGGLAVLSGGLIGPEGTPRDYDGDLDGTPVFLGCGDRDPHIPVERVHETRDALSALDGDVTERIYEGMSHGINQEEMEYVRNLVEEAVSGSE
ncbi:alpha/beta hydrolase [Halorussus gelatinilyticus]|uniref:Alpha/beta hydrolase n=1 Tax=Halorussus gelatinilyticus TaxID=2937524 RepID=A0A8U0II05_9EURY|nr:dienelactone hydrolase family protein [Halorussus gelatinilyticus]UPW00717.1 alpha/beta hydrolase [Halorussus gelatinilyticus]